MNFLPGADGSKLTLIWHIPPGGIPAAQLLLAKLKNCPLTRIFVTRSFVLPLLCKVTDAVAPPVPGLTLPKLSDFGETAIFGGACLGVAVAIAVAERDTR